MHIILDTNILRQDFQLNSNKFNALFSYLDKTLSEFILPEVVIREATNLFRHELQDSFYRLKTLSNKLESMILMKLPAHELNYDINLAVDNFRKLLISPRKNYESIILEINPAYLNETIDRLIECKKPASTSRKEFRDIIIWLSIVEYLSKNKSEVVAFISANIREFADESGKVLAKELRAELASLNLNLLYYNSIESFLKEQASKVDFVTLEWIDANIEKEIIRNTALEKIQSEEYYFRMYLEKNYENFTGEYFVTNIFPLLNDFFVYDMHTDGIYLHLTYYADVEIQVGSYLYSYYPEGIRSSSAINNLSKGYEKMGSIYPKVYLYLSAKIIENNKIVDFQIEDWELSGSYA